MTSVICCVNMHAASVYTGLEAKRLIDQGDMTVTEVALGVGYNSLPSFSKVFPDFSASLPWPASKIAGRP